MKTIKLDLNNCNCKNIVNEWSTVYAAFMHSIFMNCVLNYIHQEWYLEHLLGSVGQKNSPILLLCQENLKVKQRLFVENELTNCIAADRKLLGVIWDVYESTNKY
jgi:hypothetical protein